MVATLRFFGSLVLLEEDGHEMGPKLRISMENCGKIIALSEELYSQREIAARVGYSRSAVEEAHWQSGRLKNSWPTQEDYCKI